MKINLRFTWVIVVTLLVSLPLPALGRFISVDPKADQYPGLSPYVYCANNPIRLVDPDGASMMLPKAVQENSERAWKRSPVLGILHDMAYDPSNCMIVSSISGPVVKPAATGLRGLLSRAARRVFGKTDDVAGVASALDEVSEAGLSGNKIPSDQLTAPPSKRGNAPLGSDGKPVELHHRGQNADSPLDELTFTEHRGQGNYKKNHPNTGQNVSKIDRKEWSRIKKEYWKNEWDSGRFNPKE